MGNMFQLGKINCNSLLPMIKIVRKGIMPLFFIGIPIALILFGTIDLGKAVIASKEDEVKAAQKMLIKRAIYAIALFLVVPIVNIVMELVSTSEVDGTASWSTCWNQAK